MFSDIENQQQELSKGVVVNPAAAYLEAVHSSLKLDELHKSFCALSEKSKRTVLRTMSTQLLYLHAIALCLPPEIVKDHIVFYMFDGEKKAIEKAVNQFYVLPVIQAFDVYHTIQVELIDDTKPISPLYAASQEERNAILIKAPRFSSVVRVNVETKKLLDEMPDELKVYVKDKKVIVLGEFDRDLYDPKQLTFGVMENGCIAVSSGALVFGVLEGFWALVACGPNLACSPTILIIDAALSGATGAACCGISSLRCSCCMSLTTM